MKKKLILALSLVFVFCCFFVISANAQCTECTDNWTVNFGEDKYLGEMVAVNTCADCGTELAKETISPMFETLGYSYNTVTLDGITQHYAVNLESLARYEALTGKTVLFGVVASSEDSLVNGHPIDNSGKPVSDRVIAANFKNTEYEVFDIKVTGIPEKYRDSAKMICSAYVIVDGAISYIDNGKTKDTPSANTFDEVKEVVDNPVPDWARDRSLKILTIGNSFSDDAMEYVYGIAKAAGIQDVELGNIRRDSCSLEMHINSLKNDDKTGYIFRHWVDGATAWDHVWGKNNAECAASVKDVFEMGIEWDFVVIQQVSSSTDYSEAQTLIDLIKPYCPNATLAWHMTWATKSDGGTMYNNIVNATKTQILPLEDIDVIIPTGAAIQNAKASALSNDLIYRPDGKHLSYGMGRYIASMTLFKTLTGISIDNIEPPVSDTEGHSATSGSTYHSPPFNITESMNELCIAAANGAVANPPVQVAAVSGKEE